MALVRMVFKEDPENMKPLRFAKLAGEAVYLKHLEFKLMKNAMQSALAPFFEVEK